MLYLESNISLKYLKKRKHNERFVYTEGNGFELYIYVINVSAVLLVATRSHLFSYCESDCIIRAIFRAYNQQMKPPQCAKAINRRRHAPWVNRPD